MEIGQLENNVAFTALAKVEALDTDRLAKLYAQRHELTRDGTV